MIIDKDPDGRIFTVDATGIVPRKVLLNKTEEELLVQVLKDPNPDNRILPWEAINEHGVYDYDIEKEIIESRKMPIERFSY